MTEFSASELPPLDSHLALLRERTQSAHVSMERAVDIKAHISDLESYRALVARFYGFYASLEAAMQSKKIMAPEALELDKRWKTAWLKKDLLALGLSDAAIEQLPRCTDLPPLQSIEDMLGCEYVLEESSLAGHIIARQLQQTLGLGADNGARFFNGYEGETGARWRGFGNEVNAVPMTEAQQELLINSANVTFARFERWLRGDLTNIRT